MRVLLMRHGEAVRNEGIDEARHLARSGRRDVISVARSAAPRLQGTRIGVVVSSHLVRAVQTAELVAAELARHGVDIDDVVRADACFEPDGSANEAARKLEAYAADEAPAAVLCVCHEPIVRGIAAALAPGGPSLPFATAELAYFEAGVVRWKLRPGLVG